MVNIPIMVLLQLSVLLLPRSISLVPSFDKFISYLCNSGTVRVYLYFTRFPQKDCSAI